MVDGQELRKIAATIINIVESGKVRSLDDLNQLVGMKVPFSNGDIFEIRRGSSGNLRNPKIATKISYGRPNWGIVLDIS